MTQVPAVIFDIDGTLADNSHRQHLVQTRPKNWKAYNELMHLDAPVYKIIRLINIFRESHSIILCTGRNISYRQTTTRWLNRYNIRWEELYMRPDNDFRADDVIKEEMLKQIREAGYDPEYAIDDRNSVVAMWRRNGLICLQGKEGDF